MLESLYWQSYESGDYIQFLCEIFPGINAHYLQTEQNQKGINGEGRSIMHSFVRLRSLGSGIDFNYRYGNGNDFFIYHLGLEEH